jgi:hypothetical protein
LDQFRQAERGEPQRTQNDADRAREHGARAQAPGLERGQREHAEAEGQRGDEPQRVAPSSRRRLERPAQQDEGRDVAHAEERDQREEDGHHHAHAQPRGERPPRRREANVHGQEITEQARQQALHGQAQRRAGQAARQAHGHGLGQVDRDDAARARAETAQDGDGVHLPFQEHVHGAGHAQAAEHHRHQRDKAEVPAQAAERVADLPLVLGHGADADALGGEERPVAVGQRLRVRGAGQAHERLVARPRAEGDEPGLVQGGGGDEDPRPEGRAHADVARDVRDLAADLEAALAEGQGVAHVRVEGHEQRGVHEREAARVQPAPLIGRVGLDASVEGIAGLHRGHLHETGARGPGHVGHGREARDPRGGRASAGAGHLGHQGVGFRRELPRAGHGQVGAQQRARLIANGVLQVLGERVDGHQRPDPDRHRGHERAEPAGLSAGLAPRHVEDEAEPAHPVSETTLPSARRMTRRARFASSGSWVTRTSVVWSARFISAMRSITVAPVAASRLPVGSSAKTMRGVWLKARAMATRCCSPPESWAG